MAERISPKAAKDDVIDALHGRAVFTHCELVMRHWLTAKDNVAEKAVRSGEWRQKFIDWSEWAERANASCSPCCRTNKRRRKIPTPTILRNTCVSSLINGDRIDVRASRKFKTTYIQIDREKAHPFRPTRQDKTRHPVLTPK